MKRLQVGAGVLGLLASVFAALAAGPAQAEEVFVTDGWSYPPLFSNWASSLSPSGDIGYVFRIWSNEPPFDPVNGIDAENIKMYFCYPGFHVCGQQEEYETDPYFHVTAAEDSGFDPAYPGLTYVQAPVGGCQCVIIEIDDPNYQGISYLSARSPDLVGPNGRVDLTDYVAFQAAFLTSDYCANFNGSGIVDIGDFVLFQSQFLARCP